MRFAAVVFLALAICAAMPTAHGRAVPLRLGYRRSLGEKASQTFDLPAGALNTPSPLLGAGATDGWTAVPGAQSPLNSTTVYAEEDAPAGAVESRIIEGDIDAKNELFPYAAYLMWELDPTDGTVASCTGSVLAPNFVLTAAHCLHHDGRTALPADVSVWIKGKWHTVAAVFVREGFADNSGPMSQPANDIGMVQLREATTVPPVALPTSAFPALPAPGSTVYAAGYGITDNGEPSDVLRYTDLTVFAAGDAATCPSRGFTDNFCAGGTNGYTCNGDSGGPIVLPTQSGDVLVGLTSWGPSDCRTPYGFYVTVTQYLDQIQQWMASPAVNGGVVPPGIAGSPGSIPPSGTTPLVAQIQAFAGKAYCALYGGC